VHMRVKPLSPLPEGTAPRRRTPAVVARMALTNRVPRANVPPSGRTACEEMGPDSAVRVERGRDGTVRPEPAVCEGRPQGRTRARGRAAHDSRGTGVPHAAPCARGDM